MAESKDPPKKGRPTRYTKRLGDAICAQIAEGKSLRTICDSEKMPDKSTVFRWLGLKTMSAFRDQYARAKTESADAMNEDLMDIAEDAIKEVQNLPDDSKLASAIVQAHKLKSDNLKWSMARLKPKKYGDRLDVTSGGDKLTQTPLVVSTIKARNARTKPETTASS